VTVVLGASAADAVALLGGAPARVVVAHDWAEGMSASLRAGLGALESCPVDSVAVTLVDLPDLTAEVVRRVAQADRGPSSLARAAYAGTPGHPVLLGRDHWAGVLASASGDAGARDYLAASDVELVECGDLATGQDRDRPLRRGAES
jgi:CTP:molybdopterin cytidylyltransferase MocA